MDVNRGCVEANYGCCGQHKAWSVLDCVFDCLAVAWLIWVGALPFMQRMRGGPL